MKLSFGKFGWISLGKAQQIFLWSIISGILAFVVNTRLELETLKVRFAVCEKLLKESGKDPNILSGYIVTSIPEKRKTEQK